MWRLLKMTEKECKEAQDALERTTSRAGKEGIGALGALLAALPEKLRAHLNTCGECRIFADELVEVREMFQGDLDGPQPGPFFLARVMASIAEREGKLAKSAQTWAAVPKLAYRVSVLASLTLLIAASWLYEPPTRHTTTAAVSAEQSSEGLVEGGATAIQDDFLLNIAD